MINKTAIHENKKRLNFLVNKFGCPCSSARRLERLHNLSYRMTILESHQLHKNYIVEKVPLTPFMIFTGIRRGMKRRRENAKGNPISLYPTFFIYILAQKMKL